MYRWTGLNCTADDRPLNVQTAIKILYDIFDAGLQTKNMSQLLSVSIMVSETPT